MNRWQKIAIYNLIIIGTSLILCSTAVLILWLKVGTSRAFGGLGFLGICGLMGLSPILFRKKDKPVDFDERDRLIGIRAGWVGFGASYMFYLIVCMVTWGIVGINGHVSAQVLPMMVVGGMIIMMLGQSIATLIGYGLGGKNHE